MAMSTRLWYVNVSAGDTSNVIQVRQCLPASKRFFVSVAPRKKIGSP
jgi:hypothetical protein